MNLPSPFYQDADVVLYHANALDVLPSIDAVDHVITDPPYLLNFDNCVSAGTRNGFLGEIPQVVREMGYAPFTPADVELIAPHLARITRRWCLVFSDAESNHTWREHLCGPMKHVRVGAWVRTNATPQFSGDRPGTGFELCEIAHGPPPLRWNGYGRPACWSFAQQHGQTHTEANEHPTPKPLDLLVRLVEDFTDVGDTILDSFAGSGQTGVAAKMLDRKAILIEQEARFCDLIARRLDKVEKVWRAERKSRARQTKMDLG